MTLVASLVRSFSTAKALNKELLNWQFSEPSRAFSVGGEVLRVCVLWMDRVTDKPTENA